MAEMSAVEDDLRVYDDFAHNLEELGVLNDLAAGVLVVLLAREVVEDRQLFQIG